MRTSSLRSEDQLRLVITGATTIDRLLSIYDSHSFQDVCCNLRRAQGCSNKDDWSREWATRLRHGSDEDEELDRDCLVCLTLLSSIVASWQDPMNHSVTETSLVGTFKIHRLVNVLQLCLPMLRAKTLFRMWHPGTNSYGVPWVSLRHVHPEGEQLLKKCGATIDDCLVNIMELKGLRDSRPLAKWIEPALPPAQPNEPTLPPAQIRSFL